MTNLQTAGQNAENIILSFDGVTFGYRDGLRKLTVLDKVSVDFYEGTLHAIIGPSGSGKTTALALAGALDVPEEGKIIFEGKDIQKIGLSNFRRNHVALIFQNYNLITYMTAAENVEMSMEISGNRDAVKPSDRRAEAIRILGELGITEEECRRNVMKLSGGQQQRVAIARAIASKARIILADEPTGNLDAKTAEGMTDLFRKLAHEYGRCVIVVTHSMNVAEKADSVMQIRDGALTPMES